MLKCSDTPGFLTISIGRHCGIKSSVFGSALRVLETINLCLIRVDAAKASFFLMKLKTLTVAVYCMMRIRENKGRYDVQAGRSRTRQTVSHAPLWASGPLGLCTIHTYLTEELGPRACTYVRNLTAPVVSPPPHFGPDWGRGTVG